MKIPLFGIKRKQRLITMTSYNAVSRVGKATLQALNILPQNMIGGRSQPVLNAFLDYTPLLFYNFAIDKKKGG
ncbi:MAG: hypothetical protein HY266_04880 [Deltaproteobacteria bacterium]|nr:hypothetical protein [Deltaproteobacteria bacterium]